MRPRLGHHTPEQVAAARVSQVNGNVGRSQRAPPKMCPMCHLQWHPLSFFSSPNLPCTRQTLTVEISGTQMGCGWHFLAEVDGSQKAHGAVVMPALAMGLPDYSWMAGLG